jgi:putative DNA-invertase from lambdoid prophage Rac
MAFSGSLGRRVQLAQAAALYCRVSTADQTGAHQERDLRAFAKKAGYKVVGVWNEIASGAKQERAERKKVLALAQARKGRRDRRHRTDPLGPLGQVRRAVLNVL